MNGCRAFIFQIFSSAIFRSSLRFLISQRYSEFPPNRIRTFAVHHFYYLLNVQCISVNFDIFNFFWIQWVHSCNECNDLCSFSNSNNKTERNWRKTACSFVGGLIEFPSNSVNFIMKDSQFYNERLAVSFKKFLITSSIPLWC